MELGVQAQECDIKTLFSPGQSLCMPPYQRSYSWTETEALELLSDLTLATENDTNHFIGAIVVVRPKDGGPMEIVDGQQRLTTLTILLAVLRDLEEDEKRAEALHAYLEDPPNRMLAEAGRWRLDLNHIDGPFFRDTIQKPGATTRAERDPVEIESQGRMDGNAAAFISELKRATPAIRRRLAETVLTRCAVVRVDVADRDSGYKVFRVLNTRGKEPNAHDIIKTELFEKADFNVEEANHYARIWLEHEARLGGGPFDDLLQQIRFLYDKSSKGNLVAGFRRAVLSKIDAREFLDKHLPRYVEAYEEITTGEIDAGKHTTFVRAKLNQLRALEHKNWRGAAIKFLVDRRDDHDAAPAFFQGLERLGHIVQLIIHDREARHKRYRRVLDLAGTNKEIDPEGGPFAISRDEAKKVKDRLHGRFATFGQRRSMALRLNAALEGGEALPPEADATVEHVLPRNIAKDSFWLTTWPDVHKRREQCDTLGNFVLLPHELNTKADRLDFRSKKEIYFSEEPVFALTEDLRFINSWTPDVVRKRTEQLADILIKEWNL